MMGKYTVLVVLLAGCVCLVMAGRKNKGGCKYDKSEWSACETTSTGMMKSATLTLNVLKSGDAAKCEQTKTITKKCKKDKCRYQKGTWGTCLADNTQILQKTLKRGPASCEKTKTKSRKCRTGSSRRPHQTKCKYRRGGTWSSCDAGTNNKTRTMTLKKGDAKCQQIKTVSRPCKQKKTKRPKGGKGRVCKYMFGDWTECDTRTNTMTRTLSRKRGDPVLCAETKVLSRKCRNPCKFQKGVWTQCNPQTSLMERVDTVVKGSAKFCQESRVITKKCGGGKGAKRNKKCKYDFGNWTDCNVSTNQRTKIKHLIKGNQADCESEKMVVRSCTRPNNEERCFFGQWGVFGSCMNGVMTKQRPVLQGGVECQRRGVKTKACGEE